MSAPKHVNWKKPLLKVGTISTAAGLNLLSRPQPSADLVEIRYDALHAAGVPVDVVIRHLIRRKNPVLLTLRTKREGGLHSWKSTERQLLFEQLIPHVEAVDLELQNLHLLQPVIRLARKEKRGIILSAHSITQKLTLGKATRLIGEFRHYRVQAYKIAALARSRRDLGVLARLLIDFPKLRLGVMAIGPASHVSRKLMPLLGSRLVYGYLDAPAAKNQPALKQVTAGLGD